MRGKQAIFNLEIKKKSGLSINPDIHHSKVFSSDLLNPRVNLIFLKEPFSVLDLLFMFIIYLHLKFGNSEGPNLCRVKKVDVSSTFIKNIFRSGLTLVSSNDVIIIKIGKKLYSETLNNKYIGRIR